MKIVLIDDYISRTAVQELSGETVNTLFSVKGKTDHQANGAYVLRSHGTICASILASVMPRHVELHTISTHNKDSTITLENVCTALGWCLKGPPDYICMSLGSSNWLEVKKLGQITKQLADAGSRIFAACANNGHVVFPAAYSWVTGIRYESGIIGLYQERDSPIGNNIIVGDFTTPVLEKLERENVFFMSRTNSMAAPYALGKMLSEGLILTDLPAYTDRTPKLIHKELSMPATALHGPLNQMRELLALFQKEGYQAALLTSRQESEWEGMVLRATSANFFDWVHSLEEAGILLLDMEGDLLSFQKYADHSIHLAGQDVRTTYNEILQFFGTA